MKFLKQNWIHSLIGLLLFSCSHQTAKTEATLANSLKVWQPIIEELLRSAGYGDIPKVTQILKSGVPVDSQNLNGTTAAMMAAKSGQIEILRLLADQGANLGLTDGMGDNVMTFAIAGGRIGVVEFLMQWNVDPDLPVYTSLTPLTVSILRHQIGIALVLIRSGAKVNAVDVDGETPLLLATEKEEEDVVVALLSKGANVNYRSTEGETAVEVAKRSGNLRLIHILGAASVTPAKK